MARRHVTEAERRLARQERLVGDLERGGADALSDARALLEQRRHFLGVCREHYRYQLARQEGRRDEAAFQRVLDLLKMAVAELDPHEPNSK